MVFRDENKLDTNRLTLVGLVKAESPRSSVRRDRFESKSMLYVFFKTTGVVHYVEGYNCLKSIILEAN